MKRGYAAVALIVILVGAIGAGLLITQYMRQPTGLAISPLQVPIRPLPAPPTLVQIIPLPKVDSEGGTTTYQCMCRKNQVIDGWCKLKPSTPKTQLEFFKKYDQELGKHTVTGKLYPKDGKALWSCNWRSEGHITEISVDGENLCDKPYKERDKKCAAYLQTNPACKISDQEREHAKELLKLCSQKVKELCEEEVEDYVEFKKGCQISNQEKENAKALLKLFSQEAKELCEKEPKGHVKFNRFGKDEECIFTP